MLKRGTIIDRHLHFAACPCCCAVHVRGMQLAHAPCARVTRQVCLFNLRQILTMQIGAGKPPESHRTGAALLTDKTRCRSGLSKQKSPAPARCRLSLRTSCSGTPPPPPVHPPPFARRRPSLSTFPARHYSANVVLAYPFLFDKLRKASRTFTLHCSRTTLS